MALSLRRILVVLAWLALSLASSANALEQITYYHNDALGSPIVATDELGEVRWREEYSPYGERLAEEAREVDCSLSPCTATETTWESKQWYTAKFDEPRQGLVYYGARWYDPTVARFPSVDPVEFQEGNVFSFNRYAYVNNNPYRYVDSDGRYAELAIELVSISVGVYSFKQNLSQGNYGAAALDGAGVLVDAVLTAVPFAPAVSGLGLRAAREGVEQSGDLTAALRSGRSDEGARFIVEPNGNVVDLDATPRGSYDQPNGGRTDVLQSEDHGAGYSHTHDPILNTNPSTGETFVNGTESPGRAVSAEDVGNIKSGMASRSKPKKR